ncbi:hypothetical protein SEVIR_2G439625v4 [Setaria viridis]
MPPHAPHPLRPPAMAPQPAPPKLLRRPTTLCSITVASWTSSSTTSSLRTPRLLSDLDLRRYFSESPPPPPATGGPPARAASVMPDTPEEVQRTYADVVKAHHEVPLPP